MRAVVITGLGLVTPLGTDAAATWAALTAGQSGIARIAGFDPADYPSQVAGEVKGFNPETTGLSAKDLKRCDRFIQLGLSATREAMTQAGLLDLATRDKALRERVATLLGTGIGGLASIEEAVAKVQSGQVRRMSPFFIPAMLPNLLAGQVSILYGAQGANLCPVSACATSAHAIGWGKRMIEHGEADIVIAGGAEAAVTPSAVGGFAAMRALSTGFNDNPTAASRPFDSARDGFVIGEGAATLILEEEEHAKARGATILARLAGFGQSSDAHHMTTPSEGGEGAQRAIRQALREASLEPSAIGYINAHATSTPAGDESESAALEAIFGRGVPVSATKSATGHLLGAAGALEAAIGVLALRDKVLPPTLNLANPSENCRLDYIPGKARAAPTLKAVLSNSFGFGGTNASLVITN